MSARMKIQKSLQVGAYAPVVFKPSATGENIKRAVDELHLTGLTINGLVEVHADAPQPKPQVDLTITLDPSDWIDSSADAVADKLNQGYTRDERYILSYAQTRRALHSFLSEEVEKLAEQAEQRFLALPAAAQDKYLGEPERDRVEDAKWEHADILYDQARGN